jgi:RNA polymerase sigma-70 factor (sigma-E family)
MGGGGSVTVDDDGVEVPHEYLAEEDLSALFRQAAPSLIGMAWVLLGDRATAEEVAQDAFLSLQRAWPSIRDPGRAVGYLRAAVLNGARFRLRRRFIALRHPIALPGDMPSAEDSAVLSEDRREVVAALRRLPVRQRECLVLKYYAEMTEQEISSALKISTNSVKTHVRRGMAALHAALEARP